MQHRSKNPLTSIPFRVRVGVIGDGPITDKEYLADRLKAVFSEEILRLFDAKSRHKIKNAKRTVLAFTVLTTLGGDAERLAAREVLKRNRFSLEVILPCPRKYFKAEYAAFQSVDDFDELFSKACRRITLHRNLSSTDYNGIPTLDAMDIAALFHIADQADVLLVIGARREKDSRINDIIEAVRRRNVPIIFVSSDVEDEIKIHKSQGLNADAISALDIFNSFTPDMYDLDTYVRETTNSLFDSMGDISEKAKKSVSDFLLPFYFKASQFAKENQRYYRLAGLITYSLSTAAVAVVALAILFHRPWLFGIELLMLLTVIFTVAFTKWQDSHSKWIENRFLAERLRAARFLAACETNAMSIRMPPFLSNSTKSDDWTLMAFDEVWRRLPLKSESSDAVEPALKNFVRTRWLEDQINHHKEKAHIARRQGRRLEWVGLMVFAGAVIAAILHLLLSFLHSEYVDLALTFFAILLPAAGAAVAGFRSHREYSRLAKRSENMAQNLAGICERLEGIVKRSDFRKLLHEIEGAMLIETQDWLMLMRFAELEATA